MRPLRLFIRSRIRSMAGPGNESGSASLEFVSAGMILLLPMVYLVLTMSVVQAGSLAAEGAARQAVRLFTQAPDAQAGRAEAGRAVEFALADHGIDSSAATVTIECSPQPNDCLQRRSMVTVTVTVSVALPLVPAALSMAVPLVVPLHATATGQVSRFWGTR